MANTLSTFELRHKYFQANLSVALRNALIAEAVCNVDRSDLKTLENPYITRQNATIQAVAGTYSINAMTVTDDSLSVDNEVIAATHVFDFEARTSNFQLAANLMDDLMYSVAVAIDQYVINKMTADATGTYTTPTGGFSAPNNIAKIMGDLLGKVAGYQAGLASGPFLIIENTDLTGFVQIQVASGFSYADAALNNGFAANYMGVKIYVARTGTFQTATLGTLNATNSGHRLFGMSNVATYASPRGVQYDEKSVSLKTGKEIVVYGLVAAKVWTPKASLFINITLA
jgi:hypothetical protein